MNKWLTRTVAVAALAGMSATAFAGGRYDADRYYDYAPVLRVDPVTQVVRVDEPHQVCWTEQVRYHRPVRRDSATPEIVGGIIGGVVGNQFGHGSGKGIATIAGALLGGSIAHDMDRGRGGYGYVTYTRPVRQCRVEHEYHDERHIVGYDVEYRYNGKIYHTRMDRDPGNSVRVRVDLDVAE
ncbi:MAG: glycine zipper 2TM domain-containing protein [Arenicellales bacterium]